MFESGHFLTIPQVIGAIRRRWFPAGVLSFMIVVASAVAIFMVRDKYESEGSIYLKAGRATLTVDPTASTSQTSTLLDTRQAEIQSIKEMLAARNLVEKVAEKVGIDRIIDQRSQLTRWMEQVAEFKTSIMGKKKIEALSEEEVVRLERLESCVSYIQDHLKIKASKDGNTVSISCKAHTPFLAHDIVAGIMEQFNEQYILVHKSKGSVDFFEEELAKANEQLSAREENLRNIKDELGVMTVEDKRSLIHQELAALQNELIQSESALTSVVAEIQHLETKLEEQPDFIDQETTDKASYASDLMRQNLYALEVTENELKAMYSDTHPKVIQAKDKTKTSREILEKHGGRTGETKKIANPVRLEVEKNLILATAKHESLVARIAGAKKELERATVKMRGMNTAEIRVAEATRLVDTSRNDYGILAKKLEEARIQDELNKSMMSDIAPVQPASLVLEKVFPKRGLMLAAVGMGSLFVGLAFAVWRDQTAYKTALLQPNQGPVVVGGRTLEIERRAVSEASTTAMTPSHYGRTRSSKASHAAEPKRKSEKAE